MPGTIVQNNHHSVKTPKRAVAPRKGTRLAKAKVTLDYPQELETIISSNYTIRVGTPAKVSTVEVSINQGPWLACRNAAGYWWYDWSGYDNGEYEITARAKMTTGPLLATGPRQCRVSR